MALTAFLLSALLPFAAAAQEARSPAARVERYTPAALQALQAKDRIVLLQFSSRACEMCPQQERALDVLARDPLGGMPVMLRADLEKDAELPKRLGVSAPATLLLLRGTRELGRAAGLRVPEDIREFIFSTLSRERGKPKPRPKRKLEPRR